MALRLTEEEGVRLNKRQKCFIEFIEKPQLPWF